MLILYSHAHIAHQLSPATRQLMRLRVVQKPAEAEPAVAEVAAAEDQEAQEKCVGDGLKLHLYHLPHTLRQLPRHLRHPQDHQSLQKYGPSHHHSLRKTGQKPPPENDAETRLSTKHSPKYTKRCYATHQRLSWIRHSGLDHQPHRLEIHTKGAEKEEQTHAVKRTQRGL